MYLPAFHDPPVKTPRQVGESKPNWKHGNIKLVLQTSQKVEHGFRRFSFFLSTPVSASACTSALTSAYVSVYISLPASARWNQIFASWRSLT